MQTSAIVASAAVVFLSIVTGCSLPTSDVEPSGIAKSCVEADRDACMVQEVQAVAVDKQPVVTEIETACKRMFIHRQQCGSKLEVSYASICETRARTERPEVAEQYECEANAACGQEHACESPTTDFGDRLCEKLDATCGGGFCSIEQRIDLNHAGAYLKESVLAVAMSCARAACEDRSSCVAAFVRATKPLPKP